MSIRHIAVALCLGLTAIPSQASSRDIFNELSGQWWGSGKAYFKATGNVTASCRLTVRGARNTTSMKGNCWFLLFHQTLGLDLKIDRGHRVTGTYTGSRTGPAKVRGTLVGEKLVLAVTWGAPVNGDRTAQMILRRTGENSFQQTVVDRVNGKLRTTADFLFKRK